MPLKKPKKIPKIPKARKTEIDKLKETIPQPKENHEIEYNCSFYFKFNSKEKKQQYAVLIQTEKIFSTLNYEITSDHQKNKREIDISLLGLKPKQAYTSDADTAKNEILFDDLYGEYTVNILKKDGSMNSVIVDFNIYKKLINIKKEFLPDKKNNRKFCNFEVAEDRFTFE